MSLMNSLILCSIRRMILHCSKCPRKLRWSFKSLSFLTRSTRSRINKSWASSKPKKSFCKRWSKKWALSRNSTQGILILRWKIFLFLRIVSKANLTRAYYSRRSIDWPAWSLKRRLSLKKAMGKLRGSKKVLTCSTTFAKTRISGSHSLISWTITITWLASCNARTKTFPGSTTSSAMEKYPNWHTPTMTKMTKKSSGSHTVPLLKKLWCGAKRNTDGLKESSCLIATTKCSLKRAVNLITTKRSESLN